MQDLNLFYVFIDRLSESKIEYMVTGSIASIVYGEPRITHDIDIVVSLKAYDTKRFVETFPLEEFYCPPEEVIKTEILKSNRGHFNLIHHKTGFKADIYLIGSDEFQNWAIINKKEIDFLGRKIFIAPIEYVILKKLEFYREGKSRKHITDIENILYTSIEKINFKFLKEFIEKFALEIEWDQVNKS